MEYRFDRSGGMAIFTLEGRIDAPGAIRLDTAIREKIDSCDIAVLFDMAEVSYISSAGIRVLSGLEKRLREKSGRLLLCEVRPVVGKVLEITGYNRIFTLCPARDDAMVLCRIDRCPLPADRGPDSSSRAQVTISSEILSDHEAVLQVTGSGGKICRGTIEPSDRWPRIFNACEFSAGIGVPGESIAGDDAAGPMVTMGGAIFWKPAGCSDPPDFLIPRPDAPRIILDTAFSASIDDRFHEILRVTPDCEDCIPPGDLFAGILKHVNASRNKRPPVLALIMYAGLKDPAGTLRTLASLCIFIDTAADLSGYDRDALDAIFCQKGPDARHNGIFQYDQGILFDSVPGFASGDLRRLISSEVEQENGTDLVRLCPDARITGAIIGLQYISAIDHTGRMPVRIAGDCPGWNRTYETLARWLHPGCTELELQPLTGGFSGTLVFRVNARDSRGRLMMPLVMKLGRWDAIEPEIRGYTDHVKRYIQNNATQIIETERIGEYGGILYNFVGIRGAESRIFSLEDYYLANTPDKILPVFDSLFGTVLQGWYGEPKRKDLALYREYNRFWKYDAIRAYAASHFGATPDMEEIELPFGLGRSTNPLFFIEKVMPGRMNDHFPVFESSVHGDLNMKNVLMDETANMWLIDFAETRYSHILRDIVKLEAVIKGEMIPVSSREELANICRMDAQFLSARSLSEIPSVPDTISDPALEKAFRVVQKLRSCADRITPGDDDISQYYLGLLPYTINLLSYSSVNEYQKEYGWIAASLICRQLTGRNEGKK